MIGLFLPYLISSFVRSRAQDYTFCSCFLLKNFVDVSFQQGCVPAFHIVPGFIFLDSFYHDSA